MSTLIEWTDETWNPVTGCTKLSTGSDVQTHRERLLAPIKWRAPRRVSVNSMSDLFHHAVPNEIIAAVFAVMAYCAQHAFQVLTKRPERMHEWFDWVNDEAGRLGRSQRLNRVDQAIADWMAANTADGVDLDACLHNYGTWPLPNVWLGVSCEDQETAAERIPVLLDTPAAVRFVSCEPLLGPGPIALNKAAGAIDLVIVGGESGPNARRCDVAWIRSVVQQCRAAGVACFVRQLGAHVVDRNGRVRLDDRKGGDPAEWPEDLRVREWPAAGKHAGAGRTLGACPAPGGSDKLPGHVVQAAKSMVAPPAAETRGTAGP